MWFEIDASGIKVNGYKPKDRDNRDREWCKCDFLFSSGDWLNYHRENDEVLLCSEVEVLEDALTELLGNKLSEAEEIICIEPDFVFKLDPQNINVEWKIYFWHGGLTDNYLTITLGREDVERFRDYLMVVIGRI